MECFAALCSSILLFLFSVSGHSIPSPQVHWKSPLSVLPNLSTSLLPTVFPLLNWWLAGACLSLPLLPIPSQSFAPACTTLSCPAARTVSVGLREGQGDAAGRSGVVWLAHPVKNPPAWKQSCSPKERSSCGSGCTYSHRKAPGAGSLACCAQPPTLLLLCTVTGSEWSAQPQDVPGPCSGTLHLPAACPAPLPLFVQSFHFISQFLALIFLLCEV